MLLPDSATVRGPLELPEQQQDEDHGEDEDDVHGEDGGDGHDRYESHESDWFSQKWPIPLSLIMIVTMVIMGP